MEPLVDQWDTPLALELQPAVGEWSSEWLLPAHELSSAPKAQALSPQGLESSSVQKTEEEYWKEPDLPW
jgi:hypothetical protein